MGANVTFQAWLGRFAFLDLWVVVTPLTIGVRNGSSLETSSLSVPQLPVCQAYGDATVFPAFYPNGLKV